MVDESSQKDIRVLIESKKLLVFDFDGVLADSVEIKTEAFAMLYKPYGEEVVKRVVEHHRQNGGVSRFEKFKYYHKTFLGEELDSSKISILSNEFSSLVVDGVIASNEIAGVGGVLSTLREHGKQCIVISATPQNEIDLIVKKRGMADYFSRVYGAPSSKVDNLLDALNELSMESKDAIFFGDSFSDWEASVEVGVSFVGVGRDIKNNLEQPRKTDLFIDDFREIFA